MRTPAADRRRIACCANVPRRRNRPEASMRHAAYLSAGACPEMTRQATEHRKGLPDSTALLATVLEFCKSFGPVRSCELVYHEGARHVECFAQLKWLGKRQIARLRALGGASASAMRSCLGCLRRGTSRGGGRLQGEHRHWRLAHRRLGTSAHASRLRLERRGRAFCRRMMVSAGAPPCASAAPVPAGAFFCRRASIELPHRRASPRGAALCPRI